MHFILQTSGENPSAYLKAKTYQGQKRTLPLSVLVVWDVFAFISELLHQQTHLSCESCSGCDLGTYREAAGRLNAGAKQQEARLSHEHDPHIMTRMAASSFIKLLSGHHLVGIKQAAQGGGAREGCSALLHAVTSVYLSILAKSDMAAQYQNYSYYPSCS